LFPNIKVREMKMDLSVWERGEELKWNLIFRTRYESIIFPITPFFDRMVQNISNFFSKKEKWCTNKRLIFNASSVLFWHHSFFLMLEVTDTRVPDSSYYPPSNQNSINPTASCISYFQASMWDEYKKQRFNHYLWKWEAKSNEKKVILRFVNACWQGGNHVLTKKA
jgi:hypothetical protein